MGIASALAYLCRTPRQLKQSLRHCWDVCERLKGEIDFDDVLAVSMLRVAEPDVFALIQMHIVDLRRGQGKDKKGELLKPFERELEAALEQADPMRCAAINKVVDFVFPDRRADVSPNWQRGKPQGLGVLDEVDYWRRYSSLARLDDERGDQEILKVIKGWQKGEDSRLPELLCGFQSSARVRSFSWLLDEVSLIRLLRAVVLDSKLGSDGDQRILYVWGMMTQRPQGGFRSLAELEEAVASLLADLLGEVTTVKLAAAHELVSWFAPTDPAIQQLLGVESSAQLFKRLYAVLCNLSQGTLAAALDAGPALDRLLNDLVHRLVKGSARITGGLKEEILVFRRLVWEEAQVNPEIILPRIAIACAAETLGASPATRYAFRSDVAAAFFDLDELRSLFAKAPPSFSGLRPELLGAYQAVRDGLLRAPAAGPSSQAPSQ